MLSDHKSCDDLADMYRTEIVRLERIIKIYREMTIAAGMRPEILDNIEDEDYNKGVKK